MVVLSIMFSPINQLSSLSLTIGHEYPRTETADELLRIAFEEGIIPAITQDQLTNKPKSKEERKKKWETDNNSVEEDDNVSHSSVYEFDD